MKRGQGGFTLIEVMVAMVILASSAYILLGSHMSALWLYDAADTAVYKRSLLEQAIGEVELKIVLGELNGSEEFGPRHENVKFNWDAQLAPIAADQIPLYQVTVNIEGGPEGEEFDESVTYFMYNTGLSL